MTILHSEQPATFLAHITDTTDLAAQLKIKAAYAAHTGRLGLRADIIDIAGAASTTAIGWLVSEQLNNSQRPVRLVLAVNAAPTETKEGTADNARSDFYFAELDGGAGRIDYVGGTLKGHELSYVRGRIKSLWRLTTTNSLKSQFRSLEVLPEHLVKFTLPAERSVLLAEGALVPADTALVADKPAHTHVVEVDNFGNIKLCLSGQDRAALQEVADTGARVEALFAEPLSASQQKRYRTTGQLRVTHTLFEGREGESVIALNSSSVLDGGQSVPFIANLRQRPAETLTPYALPAVGTAVKLQAYG